MKPTAESLAEHAALTSGVGLAPLTGRTLISVTGADRTQFLQSFTTNDIKQLVPSGGCEAFVTSTQGKTFGHVLIFCEPDQFVLDGAPAQSPTLIQHFERYVITEDVQFIDRSTDFCDILVAGADATSFLKKITGVEPPSPLNSHVPAIIAGHPVAMRRVDFAGPEAFFVQAAAREEVAIRGDLVKQGAITCGPAAVDAVRLESGTPLFGLDITDENLPQEVNRDSRAISFTNGCYLGQETVARIDAVGHVNRLLVGVKFSNSEIPATGTALLANAQPVGHITSAVWSPRLNAPLALAYVRRNFSKPGTNLSTDSNTAEVIQLPLA